MRVIQKLRALYVATVAMVVSASVAMAQTPTVSSVMTEMVDDAKGNIMEVLPIAGGVLVLVLAFGFGIRLLKKGTKSS